jgi:type I restriction enzyme S subunit
MSDHSTNGWRRVPLGTVAEFRNGVNFSKENFGTGIRVIGVGDFQDNVRASYDNLDEINPQGVVRKEHLLQNGDILFVRSNGNRELIGRNMYVENVPGPVTHSAFSIRLRFVSPECHSRFYAYLFRSKLIRQALSLYGGGTNISNLNQDILGRLEVPVPLLQLQESIAGILSAYDCLIENNIRRIKILEQMAQMLYREWFVTFHFPGYEKATMVKSDLGMIPNGWKCPPMDEVVTEIIDYRGKTPKKLGSDWSANGVIALSALNVKQGRLENLDKAKRVDEDLYRRWMKSELEEGDILLTSEAPLGQLFMLTEKRRYCLSQRLFSIRANHYRILPSLLFMFLSSHAGQEQLTTRSSGTTVLGIRQSDLRKVPVLAPPPEVQRNFDNIAMPILKQIDALGRKNDNLRTTRDMLLPKLVSGEVNVEQIEKEAVAEMV